MSSARNLLIVNVIVLATILIGMANNILVTKFFGLTRLLDSYYAALVIPEMCMNLFLDFLGRNFLPAYAEVRTKDAAAAARLASAVVTIVGLTAIGLILIMIFLAKPLLSLMLAGFTAAEIDQTVVFFYILAPTLALMAINTFNEYVYQYREQFARMALYRACVPGMLLVAIVAGHNTLREYALPVGFLAGHLVMFLLLVSGLDFRYRPRITFERDYLRRIFWNSGVLIGAGFIGRARSFVSQYYCSLLGPGTTSALALANKICLPLHQSSMLAMRLMVFSKSVKLFVSDDQAKLGALYKLMISMVLLVLTPLAVWVVVDAKSVVELLFLRGKFTADMSGIVTAATVGLAVSIPLAGANETLSNAFYATNRSHVIAFLTPASTLAFVLSAVLLTPRIGVLGLALSAAASELTVFVVLVAALAMRNPSFHWRYVAGRLAKYGIVAAVTVWIAVTVTHRAIAQPLVGMAVSLVAAAALYVATLLVLQDVELKELLGRLVGALRPHGRAAAPGQSG
jgi:putative peptidoglycan lipid II flippase